MIAKLFLNGLRFRLLKCSGKPHRLESISIEITHRCMCRCRMCNIWKILSDVPELDLPELQELLSSPELRGLKELDLTGGEPFLRRDLGGILQSICDLQPSFFPDLRTISITTNGILTDRIMALTKEILSSLQQRGIDLVLACGMDAVGDLHDRIRNFPGAWEKLDETLSALRQVRESHPSLILGVKTTILPLNARELGSIADYADKHHLFTIISPRIITPNRFGNLDLEEDLDFAPEELDAMRLFFESQRFAWSGHREALVRYLRTGRMEKPCSAGFNSLFVRHSGEVFACPIIASPLGSIKVQSLGSLFRSAAAGRFRRKCGRFPECAVCTEPGMERIAWPLEGFALLRVLAGRGRGEFKSMTRHMGLDKYF